MRGGEPGGATDRHRDEGNTVESPLCLQRVTQGAGAFPFLGCPHGCHSPGTTHCAACTWHLTHHPKPRHPHNKNHTADSLPAPTQTAGRQHHHHPAGHHARYVPLRTTVHRSLVSSLINNHHHTSFSHTPPPSIPPPHLSVTKLRLLVSLLLPVSRIRQNA